MNDSLCLRALHTVGIDMAHNIVADFFFSGYGYIIVDIVYMLL